MKNLKSMWATTKAASVEKAASDNGVKGYYAAVSTGATALAATSAVFAQDEITSIGQAIGGIFSTIGNAVMAIATGICAAICMVCLLLRMLSKNPKTADEATSWMKRAILAWACISLITVLVRIAKNIMEAASGDAGQYQPEEW